MTEFSLPLIEHLPLMETLSTSTRSIVLFGGLGTWAILEMISINRREGAWVKAPIPAWLMEIKGHAISLVIFFVVLVAHPYITGVALH